MKTRTKIRNRAASARFFDWIAEVTIGATVLSSMILDVLSIGALPGA